MSIDEKKATLTAAGYRESRAYGDLLWFAPDDITAFSAPFGEQAIDKAYAHWQRAQELAALRQYVLRVHDILGDVVGETNWQGVEAWESAYDLIKQFNIIDNALTHEDVAALRHNRLDSLYADDESSETDE